MLIEPNALIGETDLTGKMTIRSWTPEEAKIIYEQMEIFNWAPWLAAPAQTLAGRAQVFPAGQLVMMDSRETPLASLSTNRIVWNGDTYTLPCWDEIAGEPTTYENTYVPMGNTLVLMSMNVHPEYQSRGLAKVMIEQVKGLARDLEISHLIGSFRPNQFGNFKRTSGNWNADFAEYCRLTRTDGLPVDGWIRSLIRNGMIPLIVDPKAMTVNVEMSEFLTFMQTYKPQAWQQIGDNIWECDEVGRWTIYPDASKAVYQESNLFGIIK